MISRIENKFFDILKSIQLKSKRGADVRIFGIDYSLDPTYVLASTSILHGTARVERIVCEEAGENSPVGLIDRHLANEKDDPEVLIVPTSDVFIWD